MALIHCTREEFEKGLTVRTRERVRIVLQPPAVCASVVGALCDTNKTFLLPRAIAALREVFTQALAFEHGEVLIVGHTDATADPDVNTPLSEARAESAAQWLTGDVEAWLDNYEASSTQSRWGKREDRLMLRYLPDFDERDTPGTGSPGPDPLVSWFQRTRGLKEDGVAGPKTRTRLIKEYFALTRPAAPAEGDEKSDAKGGDAADDGDAAKKERVAKLDAAATSENTGASSSASDKERAAQIDAARGGTDTASGPSDAKKERAAEIDAARSGGDTTAPPSDAKKERAAEIDAARADAAASDASAEPATSSGPKPEPTLVEFPKTPTTHGAGEHFPLSKVHAARNRENKSGASATATSSVTAATSATATAGEEEIEIPGDRRVDFFFFIEEQGIQPPPGEPDGPEYLTWIKRAKVHRELRVAGEGRRIHFLELHDGLFRTNSCVMLPEGETPIGKEEGQASEHESLTSVGVIAHALRFSEEHEGKSLLVAGHTDTTGTVDFNQTLSEERAEVAFCLLTGDRARFVELVDNRHKVSDYKQVLAWCSRAFSRHFACDPGAIDDQEFTGIEPLRRFQEQYNAAKLEIVPNATESDPEDLAVDGDIGPKTWGAMFDVYQLGIREELGEKPERVEELRSSLTFLADDLKHMGFSEHHPIAKAAKDNYRSQTNRRVEFLFFDIGEEPDLDVLRQEPDITEIYTSGEYERLPTVMVSAKPWIAEWEDETAQFDTETFMVVEAPGCPPGIDMVFSVVISEFDEELATKEVRSGAGEIEAAFAEWDAPLEPPYAGEMEAGTAFPEVFFEFVVEGGGRRVASRNKIRYEDQLNVRLDLDDEGDIESIINQPYVIATLWGKRRGVTDGEGVVQEKGLPPGGSSLILRDTILVDEGLLTHGWDEDER